MLSKYSKSNILKILDTKPSLMVDKKTQKEKVQTISVSLYINLDGPYYLDDPDDYYPSSKETIAYLLATRTNETIEGHPVFVISGTAGAITGFGSAIYESLLIELSKIENGALLISDRESITSGAERIYEKMKSNPGFDFFQIKSNSENYTRDLELDIFPEILSEANMDENMEYEDYLAAVDSKTIEGYHLNNAYYRRPSKEYEDVHSLLMKNHTSRALSAIECSSIVSDGEYLGEYVDEISSFCKKDMLNGFENILRDIPKKELNNTMDY